MALPLSYRLDLVSRNVPGKFSTRGTDVKIETTVEVHSATQRIVNCYHVESIDRSDPDVPGR